MLHIPVLVSLEAFKCTIEITLAYIAQFRDG